MPFAFPAARASKAPYIVPDKTRGDSRGITEGPDAQTGHSRAQDTGPTNPLASAVFITNKPRIDARNWLRPLLRLVKPSADRSQVLTTDRNLQLGPAPQMIVTRFSDKSHGLTGPDTNTFPNTGGWAYIPHQNINRRTAGKAVPALRVSNDDAHIPAIYAGNPAKG